MESLLYKAGAQDQLLGLREYYLAEYLKAEQEVGEVAEDLPGKRSSSGKEVRD